MPVPRAAAGLTVYSSLRGLAASVVSPAVLLVLGGYGLAEGGLRPVPAVVFASGLVLAGVALLDYPRHARFLPEGVERVCLMRRQLLPWTRIDALERASRSRIGSRRRDSHGADHAPVRARSGGLVARCGARRYLLVDQRESRAEFQRLRALLAAWAPDTLLRASEPVDDAPPSDLYRRRRG
ncbi:MAG TPA: hypothetical protein VHF25_12430 [Nitriliruptorales bacterium]|nr:hypothetical protein [Nitriliruptorales bacterium]